MAAPLSQLADLPEQVEAKSLQSMLASVDDKFGVWANQIPNKDPNSQGFDFYAYANDNPRYKDEDPSKLSVFNAQALKSFQLLAKRAKRLSKLISQLEKGQDVKRLDVEIAPRGPTGPPGDQGPRGPMGDIGPRYPAPK
eukprot:CAMPEP_0113673284 /NCGR_PEP_ID=MMETSP0038_2-20120614/6768_1 /TAXON_ID=2898 /ORGANISM="Cryptomonas paramecium" /LENGTH=138 /DNA_ID=CAMNT_0000589717 /DNA_START=135 /DNA_END=551 /DNA_ORIENTATION=+ /assembly_acc=CAM_ASM_000170